MKLIVFDNKEKKSKVNSTNFKYQIIFLDMEQYNNDYCLQLYVQKIKKEQNIHFSFLYLLTNPLIISIKLQK